MPPIIRRKPTKKKKDKKKTLSQQKPQVFFLPQPKNILDSFYYVFISPFLFFWKQKLSKRNLVGLVQKNLSP